MKRVFGLIVVALALTQMNPLSATASSPPPPPGTPSCEPCGLPPPPPTIVPTVVPRSIAAPKPKRVPLIAELTPTRVQRGHTVKLQLTALAGETILTALTYGHGKAITSKGKADGLGQFEKTWKVPRKAPLGKASLKLTIISESNQYTNTLAFTVVK